MTLTSLLRVPLASFRLVGLVALALAALSPTGATAQGPPPGTREAVSAFVAAMESSDVSTLEQFASERLSEEYRASFSDGGIEHLTQVRAALLNSTDDLGLERGPQGMVLNFRGEREVQVLADLDAESGRFRKIEVLGAGDAPDPAVDRDAAMRAHERAIEGLMEGPQVYGAFAEERMAPSLREQLGEEDMTELFDRISRAFAQAGAIGLMGGPDGIRIRLQGGDNIEVLFNATAEPPFLIEELSVAEIDPESAALAAWEPLTWETLADQLDEAAANGFAGSILAIREGEVVLDRGYGMADRAAERPNDSDTIYDVGSVPFDFTRGAIYKLLERGVIDLDASIADYLPDVPEDKRAITLNHLLLHESGLANFHGRPEDDDHDLTYIDRDEAERRILERPLLFAPGSQRGTSHAGFALLAAIVDRVSGTSYERFLHEELFAPAGIERTGFYGEDLGHGHDEFAVGYGNSPTTPNIPPLWGQASWLVMGSGGMFSTPADMRQFYEYHAFGPGLTGDAQTLYRERGLVLGGSDRGFMAGHITDLDGTHVYYATNSLDRQGTRGIEAAFLMLVRGESLQ
jgi:CubicO group peptidase (beta-lactamase class C family)